jgi:hypothetical protein
MKKIERIKLMGMFKEWRDNPRLSKEEYMLLTDYGSDCEGAMEFVAYYAGYLSGQRVKQNDTNYNLIRRIEKCRKSMEYFLRTHQWQKALDKSQGILSALEYIQLNIEEKILEME